MKKLSLLAIVSLIFFSCGKSGNAIPEVAVNFQAPLTDPRLSALNVAGGSVVISGYGVEGLILYREPDLTFAAYDRCSSYLPQNHCAVNIDQGGFTVTDPCSGAKWSLADGTPVKAPATVSLRSYNISVSGQEVYVTN
jgi:nitrite reductase/ring-hydroxylating ferredoxin subunit